MSEQKKGVLIVEDNSIAAMIAQKIFVAEGYETDVARDGKEALKMIHSNKHYDVIYMDIGLPDTIGIEIYRYIRNEEQEEGLNPVPIVAVTANTDHIEVCYDVGMQDVIEKPLTIEKARQLLIRFVDKKESGLSTEF